MIGNLIVLGATGAIGRDVVASAVARGRPVIAIARDSNALAALRERHGDAELIPLSASVASDGDAAALALRLRALGRPITGVVAAICGHGGRGRLLDQPADFLRRRLDEDLLPHLFAARHLLPLLAEHHRSGYVLIGGPGAEQPWAGYGQRSIGAAALRMLARVLHDEARAFAVRVQLLAIDSPVRTDDNARHACKRWPSTTAIATRALAMVDNTTHSTHAVVSYPEHTPSTSWPDDIDQNEIAAPCAPIPQEPDRSADLLTPRCLQDARRLLRSLIHPHPNSNQETSAQ